MTRSAGFTWHPSTQLVIDADSEDALRARLAGDPWTEAGLLEIARVEPWTILLDGRVA